MRLMLRVFGQKALIVAGIILCIVGVFWIIVVISDFNVYPNDLAGFLIFGALGALILLVGIEFLQIGGVFSWRDVFRTPKDRRCPKCRYDLRGNTNEADGCPECGWNREFPGAKGTKASRQQGIRNGDDST